MIVKYSCDGSSTAAIMRPFLVRICQRLYPVRASPPPPTLKTLLVLCCVAHSVGFHEPTRIFSLMYLNVKLHSCPLLQPDQATQATPSEKARTHLHSTSTWSASKEKARWILRDFARGLLALHYETMAWYLRHEGFDLLLRCSARPKDSSIDDASAYKLLSLILFCTGA